MPEEKPKRNRSTDASSSKSKDKRLTSRIATAAALSWKQQCKDLVELLRQSEDAAPFLQPVNVLDVPDYLQVIDHPMDLQTVREELQVRFGPLLKFKIKLNQIIFLRKNLINGFDWGRSFQLDVLSPWHFFGVQIESSSLSYRLLTVDYLFAYFYIHLLIG